MAAFALFHSDPYRRLTLSAVAPKIGVRSPSGARPAPAAPRDPSLRAAKRKGEVALIWSGLFPPPRRPDRYCCQSLLVPLVADNRRMPDRLSGTGPDWDCLKAIR